MFSKIHFIKKIDVRLINLFNNLSMQALRVSLGIIADLLGPGLGLFLDLVPALAGGVLRLDNHF